MTRVLVSSVSPDSAAGLRAVLTGAGFEVADHRLGSSPTVEFDGIGAAVIDAGDLVSAAVAQTKRWRLECGDDRVPMLWVLASACSETAAAALEAGADACLARPVDAAVLAAQVQALARARSASARLAAKAAEARLLGDQLRQVYARINAVSALAGQVHRVCLGRGLPQVGAAVFSVAHRPHGRNPRDFFAVRRLDGDRAGFFLGTILGQAATASSLLALFIHESIEFHAPSSEASPEPGAILAKLNKDLLALGLEDPPLVAMLAGTVDGRDGTIALARAGLSAPLYLPRAGDATAWGTAGPFLGTAEAAFETVRQSLLPGDRLLLRTGGARSEEDCHLAALGRHQDLEGQELEELLAAALPPRSDSCEDLTLLMIRIEEPDRSGTPERALVELAALK